MNKVFGIDQQRHHDQESDVAFDVFEKAHRLVAADEPTLERRKYQQWRPGDQDEGDDPAADKTQGVILEMRAPQQLEKRPADEQADVVVGQRVAGGGCVSW